MHKKTKSIPINSMADTISQGISIEKTSFNDLPNFEEAQQAHREENHSFFLLESGTVSVVIDFQAYKIEAPSITYMHPNQVHRISALENATVSSWAINNEKLNPQYLKLLEEMTPAKPLMLDEETFSIISEAVSLCIKFSERETDKLYHALLKDGCNALVALTLSQYLKQAKSADKLSRFDSVTKAFKEMLERDFNTVKSPTEYAQKQNISTPYLNECVKNTTGFSVSYHIQQRIILEAKRLLYHSNKSIKEIASELGYDDYPYFSRLFTKVAGMTASAFRNKNHE
jgi:AraC family transcriptional regulator, transcriptional activator of pobA